MIEFKIRENHLPGRGTPQVSLWWHNERENSSYYIFWFYSSLHFYWCGCLDRISVSMK